MAYTHGFSSQATYPGTAGLGQPAGRILTSQTGVPLAQSSAQPRMPVQYANAYIPAPPPPPPPAHTPSLLPQAGHQPAVIAPIASTAATAPSFAAVSSYMATPKATVPVYSYTTAYPSYYSGYVAGQVNVTSAGASSAPSNQQAAAAQAMAAQTNRGTALAGFSQAAFATASAFLKQHQYQQVRQPQYPPPPAQQTRKSVGSWKPGGGRGRGGIGAVNKMKDSAAYFCDACRITCTGALTWKLHLEGQKHKKKLAQASRPSAVGSSPATPNQSANSSVLRCDLCDLSLTGLHALNAHIKGAKHSKAVRLYQKMGKPIPEVKIPPHLTNRVVPMVSPKYPLPKVDFVGGRRLDSTGFASAGTSGVSGTATTATMSDAQIGPILPVPEADLGEIVGAEYVSPVVASEQMPHGGYHCHLCSCSFNDDSAKLFHLRGRRHRMQYKMKVKPDFKVEPQPHKARLLALRREQQQERSRKKFEPRKGPGPSGHFGRRPLGEYPRPAGASFYPPPPPRGPADYYETYDPYGYGEGQDYEGESYGYDREGWGGRSWSQDGPYFENWYGSQEEAGMQESIDDITQTKHDEIYPTDEEIYAIQSLVSEIESAMRRVSDGLTPEREQPDVDLDAILSSESPIKQEKSKPLDEERRVLRALMRVGPLAKGLLITGDCEVDLVMLCSMKPTKALLKAASILLKQEIANNESEERVTVDCDSAALVVKTLDEATPASAKIIFTSPEMRQERTSEDLEADMKRGVLDRQPCVMVLAELRRAKWFQANVHDLPGSLVVLRVMRELCRRVSTWSMIKQWPLELLTNSCVRSCDSEVPCPGWGIRRIMEVIAGGLLLPGGPGLLDPCEKEPIDAVGDLSADQREEITSSAQVALRLLSFGQMYRVLGLTPPHAQVDPGQNNEPLFPAEEEPPTKKLKEVEEAGTEDEPQEKMDASN